MALLSSRPSSRAETRDTVESVTRSASLKLIAAIAAGKTARSAMRALGTGGTALPGLLVERFDPHAAAAIAANLTDTALITGTNGKTTSAAMLARILRADGRRVVHNRAGSNLLRGVTATLVEAASPLGGLPADASAVFEADEAALPSIAQVAPPSVTVFTNLMRDQLDRYGEIESIARRWIDTLPALPANACLALNIDDPLVASLAQHWSGRCLRFGVEDPDIPPAPEGEIMDAVWDPESQADFRYQRRYFAQLGRWYTDGGLQRPQPDIWADQIRLAPAPDPTNFRLHLQDVALHVRLPAEGLYSVYNALAAATAAVAMRVDLSAIRNGLEAHEAAFGRQETLEVDGRRVRILLGKNPSGLNQALRTLQQRGQRHHLLVLLNDGVADGVDVSWIWDVDWESQADHCESLSVGGRRAADMALRLEYAGLPDPQSPLRNEIGAALRQALDRVAPGQELVILPTYTAMLEVRQRLGSLGAAPLWDVA